MNNCSNLPLTNIWQSLNSSFNSWFVAPARPAYTYQDWIGDPEDEIASYDASDLPASNPLPEINPDEFESDYEWFLS
jgi:hypothetical protein